jgi:hypothetical protein
MRARATNPLFLCLILAACGNSSGTNPPPDMMPSGPTPIRLSQQTGSGASISAGATGWGVAWIENQMAAFQAIDGNGQPIGTPRVTNLKAFDLAISAAAGSDRYGLVAATDGNTSSWALAVTTSDALDAGWRTVDLPQPGSSSSNPLVAVVDAGGKWAALASQFNLDTGMSQVSLLTIDGAAVTQKDLAISDGVGNGLAPSPIFAAWDGAALWVGWNTMNAAKLRRVALDGTAMGSDIILPSRWGLAALARGSGEVAAAYANQSGISMTRYDLTGAPVSTEEKLETPSLVSGSFALTASGGSYPGAWWTTGGELALSSFTPTGQSGPTPTYVNTPGSVMVDVPHLAALGSTVGVAAAWAGGDGVFQAYFIRIPQ